MNYQVVNRRIRHFCLSWLPPCLKIPPIQSKSQTVWEKNFIFLTDAGHVLLIVCLCCIFVCHVEGIVLCITIICAICFLRSMLVFLLVYTRLIFCIYLNGYLSGKISWISILNILKNSSFFHLRNRKPAFCGTKCHICKFCKVMFYSSKM